MGEAFDFHASVVCHSKRGGKITLYPGSDYEALISFFKQPNTALLTASGPAGKNASQGASEAFIVIHDLGPEISAPSRFNSDPDGLELFKQHSTRTAIHPQLLFLRGFPTLGWLRPVVANYKADPALFLRHLRFRTLAVGGSRSHYTDPPLPSSSTRIFQLNISTICSDETANISASPENIEDIRGQASEALKKYHQNMRASAVVADSIVRQYSILSRRFSVVEQAVSISITDISGQGAGSWNAIIWLDNARDLSRSAARPCPWCPENRQRAWSYYMFPVIQHRDHLSLLDFPDCEPDLRSPALWEANQNACLLPFQYGSLLQKDIMSADALYALSEIFKISAASEGQVLNLIHERLEDELEIARSQTPNKASMLNVRYLKKLADEHGAKLSETAMLLANREQLDWPQAPYGSAQRAIADRTASMLLNDFTHLYQRAEKLSLKCQEGIQSLANNVAFQESAKAVANAERVERLTLLATIFVPLNFTCSIFGMNFGIFGQGDLGIWVYFPTAVTVVTVSYFIWFIGVPKWTAQRWF